MTKKVGKKTDLGSKSPKSRTLGGKKTILPHGKGKENHRWADVKKTGSTYKEKEADRAGNNRRRKTQTQVPRQAEKRSWAKGFQNPNFGESAKKKSDC